jgi:hypothetical protein
MHTLDVMNQEEHGAGGARVYQIVASFLKQANIKINLSILVVNLLCTLERRQQHISAASNFPMLL